MNQQVSDIMTTKVVSISLDEKLDLVDEIMTSGDIRHMPVTQGGAVVGLLSQRDLLRAKLSTVIEFSEEDRKDLLEATDVENVMTKDVKFADPKEPITHAAKRMLEMKIGCLPVVGEGKELLGLITETDVMRYFVEFIENNES
ncbi:MAG: CBS domain-containing protein [Nitrospinaceae bacterium]|nr:CBS domain-containing protein [Nitrospinaceae bacterium]MBT3434743.1 CBS domain-containing protein [Nitrospinaceae bacterium]MBT3820927.1 CBS domain-containing protein [Nitrospinaceae bacterium]MBT4092515.1 CBS domain-containing protein [Nitrospinaceae bacterium]MBT4430879.1 CBS domain-containing protein [Nitrospinaceae bacterium]